MGRISRGHPGVIRADIPAQNFGQGTQNAGKTSTWARTSMTRRRGRPRPQGTSKNFGQKNFGLNFRSLFFGKSQRVKNAKRKLLKTSRKKKCSQKIFQKISQKIEDITFTGFYSISGYLFEIFAEDCFLRRSFRKFLPSGFLPLSEGKKNT